MRRYLYHVTQTDSRASILAHGLDHTRNPRGGYIWTGSLKGNYLFGSDSWAFQRATNDFVPPTDIWRVDVEGLDVERDRRMVDSFVVAEVVPADRLKLIATTESRVAGGPFLRRAEPGGTTETSSMFSS